MDSKVEWLYKAPSLNREEYLLGRKIDKYVDTCTDPQDSDSRLSKVLSSAKTPKVVDLSTKVREDPLFLIKQKEEAAKKSLASNPVKLKQLQKISQMKHGGKKHRSHTSHRSRSPHERPSPHRAHSPNRRHSPHGTHSPDRRHSPHRTHSPPNRRCSPHRTHSPPNRRHPPHMEKKTCDNKFTSRRLGKEELERRRQEMIDSARSHELHRRATLKKHKEEEEIQHDSDSVGPKFLQPLRVQSLSSSSSLGDRIHRNIQSVQRTKNKLDSKFLSGE